MKTVAGCVSFVLLVALASTAAAQADWCYDMDYVTATVEGGMVTIQHHAAMYNCCPDHFEYSTAQEGSRILVIETEVLATPCNCLCCYDLTVQVGPFLAGSYLLDFSWYDFEHGNTHVQLPIEIPAGAAGGASVTDLIVVPPPACLHNQPVSVEEQGRGPASPTALSDPSLLLPVAPNPAVGSAFLRFQLATAGRIRLEVFQAGGKLVRTLLDGPAPAGEGGLAWDLRDRDGSRLPTGVYFCRLLAGTAISSQRLLILQ